MDHPKQGKLKQKLILNTTETLIERNNKPCKDFHLKIFQRSGEPDRVDFVYFTPEKYEKTVEKLQNITQVEQFYEILEKQGDDKPCEIEKFVFKTLYSTLDKEELNILKKSKKKNICKNRKNNEQLKTYLRAFDNFLKHKQKQENKFRLFKNV